MDVSFFRGVVAVLVLATACASEATTSNAARPTTLELDPDTMWIEIPAVSIVTVRLRNAAGDTLPLSDRPVFQSSDPSVLSLDPDTSRFPILFARTHKEGNAVVTAILRVGTDTLRARAVYFVGGRLLGAGN